MPMSGSCAAYPRQLQIGYLPALLQKEILLNTTKADIGHIETMTNEVKKSTDGSILFCATITHSYSTKENIIAFKLSTDFSIYGVLGAMPLTSGQFAVKLPCLQGQRTRCPLPVERKNDAIILYIQLSAFQLTTRFILLLLFDCDIFKLPAIFNIYIFVGSVT